MKRVFYILFCFLIGCTEFLSPNIKETQIQINSPSDSLYANNSSLTFWWEEEASIEQYRLQIVSPGFDNPQILIDTLLLDTRLNLALNEGQYRWRLRGENESSDSPYQEYGFTLDQTPPKEAQLLQPTNGSSLSESVILQWDSQDPPINNQTASVFDSVVVIQCATSEPIVRQGREQNNWDITSLLSTVTNDSLEICWWVVSIDPAGNQSVSDTFTFFLK